MSTRIGRPDDNTPPASVGTQPTIAATSSTPSDSGLEATMAASGLPATTGNDYSELVPVDPAHYVVGNEIARGGMGRILLARDRRLGRIVALKELSISTSDLRVRFEREARITARLQHPSIVSILEAGTWPTGAPFYAMKLVAGESLDKVIANCTTVRARLELLPNAIAVVDALAYAHHQQVIHRDLKPANVLVGKYGETVVIDWGLAKELGTNDVAPEVGPYRSPAAGDATVVGSVMGTPAYMPVEQARGDAVDERADVYALGALLYHLLAGRPPYTGTSAQAILDAVLAGPPAPLGQPEVPVELVAILSKAMAYRAEDRYANAGEIATDLKKFQAGQLVGAHRYTTGQLVRRWFRKHRTAVVAASIALVVIATIGVISIRRVIDARDQAGEALVLTEAARAQAVEKQREAVASANLAIVERARAALDRDPAETLALLRQLSTDGPIGAARAVAADALSRRPATLIWRGHRQMPVGIAISRDGSHVASWDNDSVWVWPRDAAKPPITKPWSRIDRVVFCDDGRAAVFRSDEVYTVDPKTGAETFDRAWTGRLIAARCHPENRTFRINVQVRLPAGTERKDAILHFDPATATTRVLENVPGGIVHGAADGDHALLLDEDRGEVVSASSAERRRLTVPSDLKFATSRDASIVVGWGSRVVFNSAKGTRDLPWPKDVAIAVSPDGRFVAQAQDGLRVLVVATGELLPMTLPSDTATRIVFSPDSRWLATVTDELRIYDTTTWLSFTLPAPTIHDIAFAADSKSLVAAARDRTIREWPLELSQPIATRATGEPRFVTELADRTLAVSSGKLRVSPPGGSPRELSDDVAQRVAISDDRKSLAWASGGGLWRWHLGGEPQRIANSDKPRGIAIQGDVVAMWSEGLCTVIQAGAPKLIPISPDQVPTSAQPPAADQRAAAPLPEGLGMSTLRLPTIRIGRATLNIEDEAPAIALSRDGRWVAVARRGDADSCNAHVHLVDVVAGTERALSGACGVRPAFAPDSRWLATSSPTGEIVLWELGSSRKRVLAPAVESPFSLAFSPDGSLLAVGGNQNLVVFDLMRTTAARRIGGFAGTLSTLAFSDDGTRLVGTASGSVWLWDANEGVGRRLPVSGLSASFARDGSILTWWSMRADRVNDDLPFEPSLLIKRLATLPYRLAGSGVTTRDEPR